MALGLRPQMQPTESQEVEPEGVAARNWRKFGTLWLGDRDGSRLPN